MFFILEKELFKDSNKASLMLILYLGIHNKAFIQFDGDDSDIKEWQTNNDLPSWDEVYRCWLSDSTRFRQVNRVIVRESQIASDWTNDVCPIISLSDACNLISKNFELWLENERNDGSFIRCIISQETRDLFDSMTDCGQLRLNGLGGIGEMKVVLRGNPQLFGFRNKIFLICDSDAASPNQRDDNAEEIVNICQQHKIHHHCLERRSIENYVPINYLAQMMSPQDLLNSNLGKMYQAFIDLNTSQQNFFHMKTGFNNTSCSGSSIYDSLGPEVRSLLQNGFGSSLADTFSNHDINDIHNQIHSSNDEELENITSKINNYMRVPV
jgi:hypothetical protein